MSRLRVRLVAAAVILSTGVIAAGGAASATAAIAPAAAQRKTSSAREDHLAVIVNLSNPVENLTMKQLRSIALVHQNHWSNGRKIVVALHEPGPPERNAVLQLVYRMNEAGFTRYFLQATFTGQIPNGPRLLSTSEGVRRFVVKVPGAVGFVRVTDADASVKTIRVDGRTVDAPDYSLILNTDLQP